MPPKLVLSSEMPKKVPAPSVDAGRGKLKFVTVGLTLTLEPIANGWPEITRRGYDGSCQWMPAQKLKAGSEHQNIVSRKIRTGHDGCHFRPPLGQGPGFVDNQGIALFHTLQSFGRFDQHTSARAFADLHSNSHRSSEAERAETGNNQNTNGDDKGVGLRRS